MSPQLRAFICKTSPSCRRSRMGVPGKGREGSATGNKCHSGRSSATPAKIIRGAVVNILPEGAGVLAVLHAWQLTTLISWLCPCKGSQSSLLEW
ncbi:hypothetical protein E2C01_002124 [Portunus trituberculatus]|uniref:Uncharacterized protein n=1 Tax=Portunus trituberculatus TaxID=210409 RepID=A0A5B7CJJ4_PORTR|nr:hypothetical protein [Portunus trituberculatus]